MSTTPYDDNLDVRPFWAVQPVFDPDGTGGDFAYTVGLSERGFPELHLYARPSLGEDPGLDWMFSTRDSVSVLNELAAMLVRGSLGVGATLRRAYDGGLSVVAFRVDPPEDPGLLEAYGVPPGADVLPVRWSLTRAPEGPAVPLCAPAEHLARARYAALVAEVDRRQPVPPGWELPERPSFAADQRFGPMTPLVLARAAQMTTADAETLADLVMTAHAVDEAVGLSWPRVRARALGRPVGRRTCLDALDAAAEELVEAWTGGDRPTERWRELLDVFVEEAQDPLAGATVELNLRDMLLRAVRCCLTGEAVADLADPVLALWAAGPWQAASAADNRPGPEWYAAQPVLDRAGEVLAGLTAEDLLSLGTAHHQAVTGTDATAGESDYAVLRGRLTAWAVVSAGCCPPVLELLAGEPVVRGLVAALARRSPAHDHAVWGLNDWLECLTSLLVHRPRLTAGEVRTFAFPVSRLLPRLEPLLNEPV